MKKLIAITLLTFTSLTLTGCIIAPDGRYHDEPRRGGWHHDSWHGDHWH